MALGRPRGIHGHGRVDAVPALEQVGHRLHGRGAQAHMARAGADRDDDVLDGRGTQDPDRAGRGLLQRLEQRVRRGVGERRQPVGVLDDDDPPATDRRSQGGELDEVTDQSHLDGESLGGDDVDVGVRPVDRGAALSALAAPSLGALQRRRERPGGHGAPGPRRAGQQPRVGHRARVGGGPLERGDRGLLADDVPPDGHGATRPSWSRRPMTSAWICSGGCVPSTTR